MNINKQKQNFNNENSQNKNNFSKRKKLLKSSLLS